MSVCRNCGQDIDDDEVEKYNELCYACYWTNYEEEEDSIGPELLDRIIEIDRERR